MTDLAPFSDPQMAVADLLGDLAAVAYAGARTLTSIQAGKTPAIRVNRTGGADDLVTDISVMAVTVFAKDAATAMSTAEACRQRLTSDMCLGTANGTIDRAVTLSAPQLVTSPDMAVTQCATASYQISMRRPAQ
ncbi:MAG TPA: hypothetical protein VHX15_15710 [Frankiaceae bacterium]|nr:hypothetical protein [Frankiaceae bacterium]